MYREILFRGKRLYDGEWVEGYLFDDGMSDNKRLFVGGLVITDYVGTADDQYEVGLDFCEVEAETVGQYTGLCDKNCKKIFDGDIVRHYNNLTDPTKYEVGKVFWDKKRTCFRRTSNPSSVFMNFDCCYEVVGTIHDNPELLKDGE